MNRITPPPAGTSGLAADPWTPGEVYAVAADWAQAAAPVWVLGEDGWRSSGRQVADYRHSPRAALAEVLRQAIVESGDEPSDDEVEALVAEATEVVA